MICLSRPLSRFASLTQKSTSHLRIPVPSSPIAILAVPATRHFTTSKMKFSKPSMDPPKHEMAYFPNMTGSLPSESGEFRRVLWTGLYSQLVLMTVPVDGEIGDEVSPARPR